MAHDGTVTLETLLAIKRQFPAHDWSDDDVSDLLAADHGVITGFQGIVDDLAVLMSEDLGETPPMTSGRPWTARGGDRPDE